MYIHIYTMCLSIYIYVYTCRSSVRLHAIHALLLHRPGGHGRELRDEGAAAQVPGLHEEAAVRSLGSATLLGNQGAVVPTVRFWSEALSCQEEGKNPGSLRELFVCKASLELSKPRAAP